MKTCFFLSLLTSLLTLTGFADYVTSGITYGIINIPIYSGMNTVGINLEPMEAEYDAIHDVLPPDGLAMGDLSTADNLWVFDTNLAQYHEFYLNPKGHWTGSLDEPQAVPGLAVWVKANGPTTLYQIGIAPTTPSQAVFASSLGVSFIANPFPADLAIDGVGNTITWNNYCAWGKSANTGDRILVWNTTKNQYDIFFWFNTTTFSGWYSVKNNGERPSLIPAGSAFLLQRKTMNDKSIVFQNPLQ